MPGLLSTKGIWNRLNFDSLGIGRGHILLSVNFNLLL